MQHRSRLLDADPHAGDASQPPPPYADLPPCDARVPGLLAARRVDTGSVVVAVGGPTVLDDVYAGGRVAQVPVLLGGARHLVHGHALHLAQQLRTAVDAAGGGASLTVTGHGVYGTVAVLLAAVRGGDSRAVTFGAPPAGGDGVHACLRGRHKAVVNGRDVVPRCLGSGMPLVHARAFSRLGFGLAAVPKAALRQAATGYAPVPWADLVLLPAAAGAPAVEPVGALAIRLLHLGTEAVHAHSLAAYIASLAAAAGCKPYLAKRYAASGGDPAACGALTRALQDEDDLSRFRARRTDAAELEDTMRAALAEAAADGGGDARTEAEVEERAGRNEALRRELVAACRTGALDPAAAAGHMASVARADAAAGRRCGDGRRLLVRLALLRAAAEGFEAAKAALAGVGAGSGLAAAAAALVDPPLAAVYTKRACLRREAGRLGEALGDARSAVRCAPEEAEARANLSAVHLPLGNLRDALACAVEAAALLLRRRRRREFAFLEGGSAARARTLFPVGSVVRVKATGESGEVVGHARGRVGVSVGEDGLVRGCLPGDLCRAACSYSVGDVVRVSGAMESCVVEGVARGRVGVRCGGGGGGRARGVLPQAVYEDCPLVERAAGAAACLHNVAVAARAVPPAPSEVRKLRAAARMLTDVLAWLGPHPAAVRVRAAAVAAAQQVPLPQQQQQPDPPARRLLGTPPQPPPVPQRCKLPPLPAAIAASAVAAATPGQQLLLLPPPRLVKTAPCGRWVAARPVPAASPGELRVRERQWSSDFAPRGSTAPSLVSCGGGGVGGAGLGTRGALLVEDAIYKETARRKALVSAQRTARAALQMRETCGKVTSGEDASRRTAEVREAAEHRALVRLHRSQVVLLRRRAELLCTVEAAAEEVAAEEEEGLAEVAWCHGVLRCVCDEFVARGQGARGETRMREALLRELQQGTVALQMLHRLPHTTTAAAAAAAAAATVP